jgi:diguanylate cyclase (GGDEF)-like protein
MRLESRHGRGLAARLAPIVERLRQPQRPAPRSRRFAAALDRLAQGFVVLDEDYRLVINNARLYEFYPHPGAPYPRGTPLREIIAGNVAAGHHPGRNAEGLHGRMMARFALAAPFSYRHDLPSGRIILAEWHRLPDAGWVGTFEDITERHRSTLRLAHMALHDGLTDLINRDGFNAAVDSAIARIRPGKDFAVLALTLERFEKVNDSFGHAIGDALLREAAARLRATVRESDDVARLGGEEFAIVQIGPRQPAGAEALARRIIAEISAPFLIDGHEIAVGVSIGIALGNAATPAGETLLRNAAVALGRAKAEPARISGRGSWRLFAEEMDAAVRARRSLEADLRHALERNEFELFYQPLVNIGQRRVSAFEALLRWRHPERGLVAPDAFIPLAEETGLIVPIGEWVLHSACTEAARWQTPEGCAPLHVAVNLSAVQFASPGLAEAVEQALTISGLPGQRLELEVTESVLLRDNETTLATLHRLRALGARISMDDFGTGYSSLSYLRSFPFDKIKIDKSFVHGLAESDESNAIVRAIAGIGLSLGIATTAEGVETVDQLERLIADGCTEVQGYFFSPPRPAAEIPALIRAAPARQAA